MMLSAEVFGGTYRGTLLTVSFLSFSLAEVVSLLADGSFSQVLGTDLYLDGRWFSGSQFRGSLPISFFTAG
jgi:hypothetical protein